MNQILPGPDGQPRCRWCAAAPEFLAYHDEEWGFPVADDPRLFEKLCLEGFSPGSAGAPSSPSGRTSVRPSPASTSTVLRTSRRAMSIACCKTEASCATAARSKRC